MDMCAAKILLVDDDVFTRLGLSLYLQQEGFAPLEAGDAQTARELITIYQPEAAIIDIEIPETKHGIHARQSNTGVDLAIQLKALYPTLGVVLFSAYEDRGQAVFDLVRDGMRGIGYQLKGGRPSKLLHALLGVMKGRVMIDTEVTHLRRVALEVLEQLPPLERYWVKQAVDCLSQLTRRETEVAREVALGHTTQGIADALYIAPKTAENYIGRIYHKLYLSQMQIDAPQLRQATILARAFMVYDLSHGSEG